VTDEVLHGNEASPPAPTVPHDFATGADLLRQASDTGLAISDLVRANERVLRSDAEIDAGLRRIWDTMQACVARGLDQTGILPGGLGVKRRARALHRELRGRVEAALSDPMAIMDWISLYAIAVNEENAAGGRVVTAPTNGAAGIIPAVLHY
jgi:L-serine dehydratase